MPVKLSQIKNNIFSRFVLIIVLFSFISASLCPGFARASVLPLPQPNQILGLSETYSFPILKGLKLDPKNPLQIEFIIDSANQGEVSQAEASKLIKYFLAGLTIPEEDLWVNLSPYEPEKIINNKTSLTDVGEDMLAQDYVLKQLISSLTYPESSTGRDYWKRAYEEATKAFGTTAIPLNTFNKIWITSDKSQVYEYNDTVLINQATLKALLEEDLTALKQATKGEGRGKKDEGGGQLAANDERLNKINKVASSVMREIVVPKITQDVNTGKNFATLRQIYHSLILAKWFKEKFKDSFYKHYINNKKINGINTNTPKTKDEIYTLYTEAFKKGMYDYIKKEADPATKRQVRRRYFSGGLTKIQPSFVETLPGTPQTLALQQARAQNAFISTVISLLAATPFMVRERAGGSSSAKNMDSATKKYDPFAAYDGELFPGNDNCYLRSTGDGSLSLYIVKKDKGNDKGIGISVNSKGIIFKRQGEDGRRVIEGAGAADVFKIEAKGGKTRDVVVYSPQEANDYFKNTFGSDTFVSNKIKYTFKAAPSLCPMVTAEDIIKERLTYVMIKPDGLARAGEILDDLRKAGLEILYTRQALWSRQEAEEFYGGAGGHKRDAKYFGPLTDIITEGPVLKCIIKGPDSAYKVVRDLLGHYSGSTKGSLREKYGVKIVELGGGVKKIWNKIHASDSFISFVKESAVVFRGQYLFNPVVFEELKPFYEQLAEAGWKIDTSRGALKVNKIPGFPISSSAKNNDEADAANEEFLPRAAASGKKTTSSSSIASHDFRAKYKGGEIAFNSNDNSIVFNGKTYKPSGVATLNDIIGKLPQGVIPDNMKDTPAYYYYSNVAGANLTLMLDPAKLGLGIWMRNKSHTNGAYIEGYKIIYKDDSAEVVALSVKGSKAEYVMPGIGDIYIDGDNRYTELLTRGGIVLLADTIKTRQELWHPDGFSDATYNEPGIFVPIEIGFDDFALRSVLPDADWTKMRKGGGRLWSKIDRIELLAVKDSLFLPLSKILDSQGDGKTDVLGPAEKALVLEYFSSASSATIAEAIHAAQINKPGFRYPAHSKEKISRGDFLENMYKGGMGYGVTEAYDLPSAHPLNMVIEGMQDKIDKVFPGLFNHVRKIHLTIKSLDTDNVYPMHKKDIEDIVEKVGRIGGLPVVIQGAIAGTRVNDMGCPLLDIGFFGDGKQNMLDRRVALTYAMGEVSGSIAEDKFHFTVSWPKRKLTRKEKAKLGTLMSPYLEQLKKISFDISKLETVYHEDNLFNKYKVLRASYAFGLSADVYPGRISSSAAPKLESLSGDVHELFKSNLKIVLKGLYSQSGSNSFYFHHLAAGFGRFETPGIRRGEGSPDKFTFVYGGDKQFSVSGMTDPAVVAIIDIINKEPGWRIERDGAHIRVASAGSSSAEVDKVTFANAVVESITEKISESGLSLLHNDIRWGRHGMKETNLYHYIMKLMESRSNPAIFIDSKNEVKTDYITKVFTKGSGDGFIYVEFVSRDNTEDSVTFIVPIQDGISAADIAVNLNGTYRPKSVGLGARKPVERMNDFLSSLQANIADVAAFYRDLRALVTQGGDLERTRLRDALVKGGAVKNIAALEASLELDKIVGRAQEFFINMQAENRNSIIKDIEEKLSLKGAVFDISRNDIKKAVISVTDKGRLEPADLVFIINSARPAAYGFGFEVSLDAEKSLITITASSSGETQDVSNKAGAAYNKFFGWAKTSQAQGLGFIPGDSGDVSFMARLVNSGGNIIKQRGDISFKDNVLAVRVPVGALGQNRRRSVPPGIEEVIFSPGGIYVSNRSVRSVNPFEWSGKYVFHGLSVNKQTRKPVVAIDSADFFNAYRRFTKNARRVSSLDFTAGIEIASSVKYDSEIKNSKDFIPVFTASSSVFQPDRFSARAAEGIAGMINNDKRFTLLRASPQWEGGFIKNRLWQLINIVSSGYLPIASDNLVKKNCDTAVYGAKDDILIFFTSRINHETLAMFSIPLRDDFAYREIEVVLHDRFVSGSASKEFIHDEDEFTPRDESTIAWLNETKGFKVRGGDYAQIVSSIKDLDSKKVLSGKNDDFILAYGFVKDVLHGHSDWAYGKLGMLQVPVPVNQRNRYIAETLLRYYGGFRDIVKWVYLLSNHGFLVDDAHNEEENIRPVLEGVLRDILIDKTGKTRHIIIPAYYDFVSDILREAWELSGRPAIGSSSAKNRVVDRDYIQRMYFTPRRNNITEPKAKAAFFEYLETGMDLAYYAKRLNIFSDLSLSRAINLLLEAEEDSNSFVPSMFSGSSAGRLIVNKDNFIAVTKALEEGLAFREKGVGANKGYGISICGEDRAREIVKNMEDNFKYTQSPIVEGNGFKRIVLKGNIFGEEAEEQIFVVGEGSDLEILFVEIDEFLALHRDGIERFIPIGFSDPAIGIAAIWEGQKNAARLAASSASPAGYEQNQMLRNREGSLWSKLVAKRNNLLARVNRASSPDKKKVVELKRGGPLYGGKSFHAHRELFKRAKPEPSFVVGAKDFLVSEFTRLGRRNNAWKEGSRWVVAVRTHSSADEDDVYKVIKAAKETARKNGGNVNIVSVDRQGDMLVLNVYASSSATVKSNPNVSSIFSKKKASDLARDIVEKNLIKRGAYVFEEGGGNGIDAIYFAKHGARVVALDNSDKMIAEMNKNIKEANAANRIDVVKADASKELPFRDNSFDVVNSRLFLNYRPDSDHLLICKELLRLLKPEGHAFILTKSVNDPYMLSNAGKKRIGKSNMYYFEETDSTRNYSTKEHLETVLRKAGFTNIKVVEEPGKSYKDRKSMFLIATAEKPKSAFGRARQPVGTVAGKINYVFTPQVRLLPVTDKSGNITWSYKEKNIIPQIRKLLNGLCDTQFRLQRYSHQQYRAFLKAGVLIDAKLPERLRVDISRFAEEAVMYMVEDEAGFAYERNQGLLNQEGSGWNRLVAKRNNLLARVNRASSSASITGAVAIDKAKLSTAVPTIVAKHLIDKKISDEKGLPDFKVIVATLIKAFNSGDKKASDNDDNGWLVMAGYNAPGGEEPFFVLNLEGEKGHTVLSLPAPVVSNSVQQEAGGVRREGREAGILSSPNRQIDKKRFQMTLPAFLKKLKMADKINMAKVTLAVVDMAFDAFSLGNKQVLQNVDGSVTISVTYRDLNDSKIFVVELERDSEPESFSIPAIFLSSSILAPKEAVERVIGRLRRSYDTAHISTIVNDANKLIDEGGSIVNDTIVKEVLFQIISRQADSGEDYMDKNGVIHFAFSGSVEANKRSASKEFECIRKYDYKVKPIRDIMAKEGLTEEAVHCALSMVSLDRNYLYRFYVKRGKIVSEEKTMDNAYDAYPGFNRGEFNSSSSLKTIALSEPLRGGIEMSEIKVASSATSKPIEFAAIGPEFFANGLSFKILSMKKINSLVEFASLP